MFTYYIKKDVCVLKYYNMCLVDKKWVYNHNNIRVWSSPPFSCTIKKDLICIHLFNIKSSPEYPDRHIFIQFFFGKKHDKCMTLDPPNLVWWKKIVSIWGKTILLCVVWGNFSKSQRGYKRLFI